MKTFIKIAILIICLGLILGLALCLTACNKEPVTNIGNDNTDSGNKGQWTEYDGLSFGYVNAKDCEDGNIHEDKIKSDMQFELGNTYYMVIDFAIQAERDNSGTDRLHTNLQIMPAEVVDATIQDAATSEFKEEVIGGNININLSYKIPELAETKKQTRLVIQLKPLPIVKTSEIFNSDVRIELSFESENNLNAVKTTSVDDLILGDYTQGLEYTEISDGGYAVSKGMTVNNEQIVIPKFKEERYVTSIGESAFSDCSSLTNITLPDSVTSIANYAFYNCSSLTNVTIPNSVTSIGNEAFYNCRSLTSITLSSSVTSIGDEAFYNCRSLTSITIPNSVTSIGFEAFIGCYGLVEVYNLSNLNIKKGSSGDGDVGFYALDIYTDLSQPSKLTTDNDYVIHTNGDKKTLISYIGKLTEITIPDSVTSIGYAAFSGCWSLTSITIGNGVTSIGDWAFNGCSSLTSITIPDSVSYFSGVAFYHCSSLTNVTCPASAISYIPKNNLQTVVITSGEIISDNAFKDCSSLISVTIPSSVTSIGYNAFYGCSSLKYNEYENGLYLGNEDNPYLLLVTAKDQNITSCKINDNTRFIHNYAFYNCSKLTSVTIGNGVTSIGNYEFEYCSSLTSITIPNSVTSIGKHAFSLCWSLASMNFAGTKSEWNAISKDTYWKNNSVIKVVHCSDGDVNV